MFHYEMHRIREAELMREARDYRQAREAAPRRRGTGRGGSEPHEPEGRVSTREDRGKAQERPVRRRRATA